MKHYLLYILALVVAVRPALAQNWVSDNLTFLSASEQMRLIDTGELTGFGASLQDLTLWNRAPFATSVRQSMPDRPSTIAAEGLFVMEKPAVVSASELNLKIIRSLTAFSTMKGLLVYSDSQKKMETFIYDSSRIDALKTRHMIPDPAFSEMPPHAEYILYQREEQTGDVYSAMTIDMAGGNIKAVMTNLTELDFLGFRLVAPEQLKTLFIIMPIGDKIVLYGVTTANTPRLFGLERIKQKSFFYRMKALASWFESNLRSTAF